jgi:hypothetical protein
LVFEESRAPERWRVFVAGLCFIEFYTQFVCNGCWLWDLMSDSWYRRSSSGDEYGYYVMRAVFECIRAIAFWGLGRALWRRRRTTVVWFGEIVLTSVVIQLIVLRDDRVWRRPFHWWGIEIGSDAHPTLAYAMSLLFSLAWLLPWAILLICALLVFRRTRRGREIRRPPWIVLAAAWMFSMCILNVVQNGWSSWINVASQLDEWLSLDTHMFSVLHVALPFLAGAWLLWTWKGAYLLPIVIAAVEILSGAAFTWSWLPRVVMADGSWRLALNRALFDALFVWWVAAAAPWLLIALLAWRSRTAETRVSPST